MSGMKEAIIFDKESDFRKWFEENKEKVGVKRIILSQDVCPDYVFEMKNGEVVKLEVELFAINFQYHRHDPDKADYILACYAKEKEGDCSGGIASNLRRPTVNQGFDL
jgi:hypothetical protein